MLKEIMTLVFSRPDTFASRYIDYQRDSSAIVPFVQLDSIKCRQIQLNLCCVNSIDELISINFSFTAFISTTCITCCAALSAG